MYQTLSWARSILPRGVTLVRVARHERHDPLGQRQLQVHRLVKDPLCGAYRIVENGEGMNSYEDGEGNFGIAVARIEVRTVDLEGVEGANEDRDGRGNTRHQAEKSGRS